MIRVCICDDDELIANRISSIIDKLTEEKNISIIKDVYYNGASLVRSIEKNKSYYDLIFLDIEMEDMDGIEAAKQLRLTDELANIIYVTSYENYAIETFAVRPYQFVVKPFEDGVIEKHFMDVYERVLADSDERFEFKFKNTFYKISIKDIKYFESRKRNVIINMNDGRVFEYYDVLDDVEKRLNNTKHDFLRIHKSILVNSRYIFKKRYNEIELSNGEKLLISQGKRKEINEKYIRKVEEIMRNGNID